MHTLFRIIAVLAFIAISIVWASHSFGDSATFRGDDGKAIIAAWDFNNNPSGSDRSYLDSAVIACDPDGGILPTIRNRGYGVTHGFFGWADLPDQCVEAAMYVKEPHIVDEIHSSLTRDKFGPTTFDIVLIADGKEVFGCTAADWWIEDETDRVCVLSEPLIITESLIVQYFFYGAESDIGKDGAVTFGSQISTHGISVVGNKLVRNKVPPVMSLKIMLGIILVSAGGTALALKIWRPEV